MPLATQEEQGTLQAPPWKPLRALARDRFLLLLLGVTFFGGVMWAALVPLWQIPDEPFHYGSVQSLGERWSLVANRHLSREIALVVDLTGLDDVAEYPDMTQPFASGSVEGPNEDEVHAIPSSTRTIDDRSGRTFPPSYPPGYYLLASLAYRAIHRSDVLSIMFGLRLLSVLITTTTMAFHYAALKHFFEERSMAKATALFIAFSPMYLYMGVAVNVDVLLWLIFGIFLYAATRALREGLTTRLNLVLSVSIIGGLWVKQTALFLIPLYVLLLGLCVFRKSLSPRKAALHLGIAALLVVPTNPWFYLGEAIRASPVYPSGLPTGEEAVGGFLEHFVTRSADYAWTFDSFWGNFGWMNTPLPEGISLIMRLVTGLALAGLLIWLIRRRGDRSPRVLAHFYLAASVIFAIAMIALNYIRISTGEDWFLQGRYFFPIMLPLSALLIRGIITLTPMGRTRGVVLVSLLTGMLLFNVYAAAAVVVPRFYL